MVKLMLRPEWRPRPFSTFLGFLDIKTGVIIALMFTLFNKVAGVYGLIAVLTGAGGSAAQLTLYIYSTVALVALGWGLKAVRKEDPRSTLYFAHIFFADHILSTSWTVFFAVSWWVYTPHDGRRVSNSPAQQAIIDNYPGKHQDIPDDRRAELAMGLWNREKGSALTLIVLGWLLKIYLALLLYSYANHLRKGTYRNLPYARPNVPSEQSDIPLVGEQDYDEDIEDFYRVPIRTPQSSSHPPAPPNGVAGSSNFVSHQSRSSRSSRKNPSLSSKPHSLSKSQSGRSAEDLENEVLFDESESGSSARSKYGGQEVNSTEDEHAPLVGEGQPGRAASDRI